MIEIDVKKLNGQWPARSNTSHKGTYGHILIIGGNTQYGGAGILASSAAVYAGGGLVTLATAQTNFTAVRSTLAEVILIDFLDWTTLETSLRKATGVVIGPGLGLSSESLQILKFVLQNIDNATPLVIDGSAIELIAMHHLQVKHAHTIFTPHQMEFQRLSGIKIADQTTDHNQKFVNALNAVVILKHYHTEIYTPNREIQQIMAGNPGMATGGSGDTLTGILIALINQAPDWHLGITLGTFLHSYVADQIYCDEAVVLPHRLIRRLPTVFKQLQKREELK